MSVSQLPTGNLFLNKFITGNYMTNTLELTKQLISIPSWVGLGCDEIKIGEFIYRWLKSNTTLTVIKQPVKDGRFNVIATGNGEIKTLVAGHMDTVENRAGWITDPWKPLIKGERLYGLGATDMKGSLAAGMVALSEAKNTDGIMFLAYCDEEYDFAGMKSFIDNYRDKISPALVISLDGYADVVGNGCRGLIEVSFKLRGKSGHAGRPEMGVNAITGGINLINKIKRRLASDYSDLILGMTTLNLAYCQGGLDQGNTYGRQGNNIPDLAEFVLDIRPAKAELTAQAVKAIIDSYLPGTKLKLEGWIVRHDLGSWSTNPTSIVRQTGLTDPYETFGGYVDTQMIWKTFNQPTCLAIGASIRTVAHSANEYVEIMDLEKTKNNLLSILKGGYND